MRDSTDRRTLELPDITVKRGVGRPRKPDAMDGAERSRRYRSLKKFRVSEPIKKTPSGKPWVINTAINVIA